MPMKKTSTQAAFLTCQKYIVISIFMNYYFCLSFFLRGIVIYKGCENEGRVTCWEKGFVI